MPEGTDRAYLLETQYRDASNLDARVALHTRFSTNRYGWFRWLFDRLTLPENARLLEVGCGTGLLWRENLHRIPAGWDVTLSDFSPGMLEEARASLAGSGRPFHFTVVDVQAIPYPEGSFDAVIANFILQHVPDRARALAEIRRVLRPGGRFYAATFGRAHMREVDDWLLRLRPGETPSSGTFTIESGEGELRALFSDVTLDRYEDGLVVTEIEPLVAYLRSVRAGAELSEEQLARFRAWAEGELAARGALRITKDSGLFQAS
jgi:ubiquinone/menaquinone biosynthesis C-methylase UbiE